MTKTKQRTEPPEWAHDVALLWTMDSLKSRQLAFIIARHPDPAVKELVGAAKQSRIMLSIIKHSNTLEERVAGELETVRETLQSALKLFQASKDSTGGE